MRGGSQGRERPDQREVSPRHYPVGSQRSFKGFSQGGDVLRFKLLHSLADGLRVICIGIEIANEPADFKLR